MSQPPQPGPAHGDSEPGYGSAPGSWNQPSQGAPDPYGSPAGGAGTSPYGGAPAYGGSDSAYGAPAPYPGYGPQLTTASMGKRLVARILDALVLGIPFGILIGALAAWGVSSTDPITGQPGAAPMILIGVLAYLVIPLVAIAYEIVLVAKGATLGKKWMGIKVVRDPSGEVPGYGPSALRYLILFVAGLIPLVGTVLVAISPFFDSSGKRQGWHDMVGKTRVVDAH